MEIKKQPTTDRLNQEYRPPARSPDNGHWDQLTLSAGPQKLPETGTEAPSAQPPQQTPPPQGDAFLSGSGQLLKQKLEELLSSGAVEINWSRYYELISQNTGGDLSAFLDSIRTVTIIQTPLQNSAESPDWMAILNWETTDEKSLLSNIEDLAACYQELKAQIRKCFPGDQREGPFCRADLILRGKLETLFSRMLRPAYEFLRQNQQPDTAEKLRLSLQKAVCQKAYDSTPAPQDRASVAKPGNSSALPQPPANEPSVGKEESAPGRKTPAGESRSLQEPGAPQNPSRQRTEPCLSGSAMADTRDNGLSHRAGKGFYSAFELQQARSFTAEVARDLTGEGLTGGKRLGLRLGLLSIKAQVFSQYAGVGKGLAAAMTAATERFSEKLLFSPGKWAGPDEASTPIPSPGEAALLRESQQAQQISLKMAETYKRTNHARSAILSGLLYEERESVGTAKEGRLYTSSPRQEALSGHGAEGETQITQKALMRRILRDNWHQFLEALGLSKERYPALYDQLYRSGLLGLFLSKGHSIESVPGFIAQICATLLTGLTVLMLMTLLIEGALPNRPLLVLILLLFAGTVGSLTICRVIHKQASESGTG